MTGQATNQRDLWGTLRRELTMRDRIAAALTQLEQSTIPNLAEHLGEQVYEVTHWVMTMRRYGHVTEVGEVDDDGYFQYALASKEADDQSEEA